MYVWLIYTFIYIDIADVTANYGMHFDFISLFLAFSYIIIDHSCLNCWYLHQTFTDYISNQYWYINMSIVTVSYGMPLNFITFLLRILNKIDEYSCLKCCIYTKLLWIICLIHLFWYVDMPDVNTIFFLIRYGNSALCLKNISQKQRYS